MSFANKIFLSSTQANLSEITHILHGRLFVLKKKHSNHFSHFCCWKLLICSFAFDHVLIKHLPVHTVTRQSQRQNIHILHLILAPQEAACLHE